jgi:glycosyltransferase involved in cell wall biosynthesis
VMRIAICNTFGRLLGGVESYLALAIPALEQSGHELAMLFEMDSPAENEPLPVTGEAWCVAEIGPDRALHELQRWNPDIVYTHGVSDLSLERTISLSAPAVHFAHDYSATCISGAKAFAFPRIKPCTRPFGAQCLVNYFPRRCGGLNPLTMWRTYGSRGSRLQVMRNYRRIVVASEAMRQEYLRNGFPPQRLETVSPPVAQAGGGNQPHPAERRCPRERAPLTAAAPVLLLFAGRMVALKGGKVLLDSLPHLVDRLGRPLILHMAGDGPARPEWEGRAQAICAQNPLVQVKFKGWLGAAELQAEFAASDLLVVPSLWPEPFGSIGPEAGMSGLPAAAFAVGGIPEWLHDGVNGFLALPNPPAASNLADAIVKCLADPVRYRQLRRGAQQEAINFELVQHCETLLGIFAAVTAETAR